MGAMQKLAGLMRRAIEKYDMIQPGDRIAVGVSGGKDSVALLVGLAKLKEYIGIDYEMVAITLDPCSENSHRTGLQLRHNNWS